MGAWENVQAAAARSRRCTASDGVRQQFTTLFDYGVFDKFPRLKVAGARVGRRLDRLLARPHRRRSTATPFIGTRVPLEHKPSDYFRERVLDLAAIPTSGRSRRSPSGSAPTGSCGRRDFPHADHTPEYIDDLDVLAGMFPDKSRRKFLGDNCRELFKIDA